MKKYMTFSLIPVFGLILMLWPIGRAQAAANFATASCTRCPTATQFQAGAHTTIPAGVSFIPEPVVFEIIKAALQRTWSTAPRDGNQIVCQFHYPVGSHIQDRAVLFCQTNKEHFLFQEKHFFMTEGNVGGSTISGPLEFKEFETDQMYLVNPNRLRRILAKLPAARGRYEFEEVTTHGRPQSAWFVNRGRLVKVIVFKKRKAGSAVKSKL